VTHIRKPAAPIATHNTSRTSATTPQAATVTTSAAPMDRFAAVPRNTATPTARATAPFDMGRDNYFAALDTDPALRAKASNDAAGAMLDLLSRDDVPGALDEEYADKAGSKGAGRVLMLLDYTRGIPSNESFLEAAKGGPMHLLSEKFISPMLTHFRTVGGKSLFPGDATMTPAFRDSGLWGPSTNQVGHLLCAVETGTRMGRLSKHPVQRTVFDLALSAAGAAAGFKNIKGDAGDWSRAGILGHEMRGDDDGTGFLGQMKAYDALVANGDKDHIRHHWDDAVAAVLRDDHVEAWKHIRAIGTAIEVPATPEELAADRANDHPRFAKPHSSRDGNSLEDVALSVYGFATGYAAETRGFETPQAAREYFEKLFSASGGAASVIDAAAQVP
jgi:hypothetical protein